MLAATLSNPDPGRTAHDQARQPRLSRCIPKSIPLSDDDCGRAGGENSASAYYEDQYRVGSSRSKTSSAIIGCCPTRSTPMVSATRSTQKPSSPRCSKAGSPIQRTSPTRCQTRNGRRSRPRSISSTAVAQLLAFVGKAPFGRQRATMSNSSWKAIRATRMWAPEASALFSARRPDGHQRSWNFGRSQSSASRGDDHGASRRRPQSICSRRHSPNSCPSRTCKASGQAQPCSTERFTAMYYYTYGPSPGATSDLTVDSGNSSSGPSGAAARPRQRDQFKRLGAVQRAQRLQWGTAAALLDRPDVEHVETYARRVSPPPGLHSPEKGPRKRHALSVTGCFCAAPMPNALERTRAPANEAERGPDALYSAGVELRVARGGGAPRRSSSSWTGRCASSPILPTLSAWADTC